jgi:hypothetical protein
MTRKLKSSCLPTSCSTCPVVNRSRFSQMYVETFLVLWGFFKTLTPFYHPTSQLGFDKLILRYEGYQHRSFSGTSFLYLVTKRFVLKLKGRDHGSSFKRNQSSPWRPHGAGSRISKCVQIMALRFPGCLTLGKSQ